MTIKKKIYRFIGWFYLSNAVFYWILGSSYLKSIFLSGSLFENSFIHLTSTFAKSFVVFYAIINYLSYMTLLAFIPACLTWLIAFVLPYQRLILILSILISSFCSLFLLVDSQVYSLFKFHLNGIILNMIFNRQSLDVFDFSYSELLEFGLIGILVLLLELLIAWFVWNKIVAPQKLRIGKSIALFWLGGFLFSYFSLLITIANGNNLLSQQNPNLPFFNQIIAKIIPDSNADDILMRYSENNFSQFSFTNKPLNYPRHPLQCDTKSKPYNVILILIDSLRSDSLNEKEMPKLNEFANHNVRFLNHFSGGNSTQPGLFSLFYSIPSNYWTAALEHKRRPVFFDVLNNSNYESLILWSAPIKMPPFDKTIFLGINDGSIKEAIGDDVGSRDKQITNLAIEFLNRKKINEPFFLNLFYDAPHGYCSEQSYPGFYVLAKNTCSRLLMSNDMDPEPYYKRYLNTVHFIDNELDRVLETITKKGYLEDSIIIITSDHGQEFNDSKQNYWGHSGNFTQFQLQIPLVIHWPDQPSQSVEYRTTSYDVVPTLLQKLFGCENLISDYSIGHNLFDNEGRLGFLIAGSYAYMGIVESDRITTLHASGQITTTDLKAKPLTDAKARMEVFEHALRLMQRYFK